MNDVLSDSFDQEWGVPQGSCPLLLVLYFGKLFEVAGCFIVHVHVYGYIVHVYGDETQVYISFSPKLILLMSY